MDLRYFGRAGWAALRNPRQGPTLYDVCDPLLLGDEGDAHMRRFYRIALANPVLRPILSRAGLKELADPTALRALQEALLAARDQAEPDWAAIGAALAPLIDAYPTTHPRPRVIGAALAPDWADLDRIIVACADDLLGAHKRRGYIPTYAAFSLIGDPDLRGRDLVTALTGLNARAYKNSTLLFNLARVFLLANPPAKALIDPPHAGIAEVMWSPVQVRHRSAYYDAFFAEALMDFLDSGLVKVGEEGRIRSVIGDLVAFCLNTSRERVPGEGERSFDVVTALAPHPHARFSPFFRRIKENLGFAIYVPDCDTTACSVSAAARFGADDTMLDQPLIDFYAAYQAGYGNNRHVATVPVNDTIDFEGGILTWIENAQGQRPFGNDLDPTLNLDVLEVTFRNYARWKVTDSAERTTTVRRILLFLRRMCEGGAFADPRSHIYYLPELFCAYAGRCWHTFVEMPETARRTLDPEGSMEVIRRAALAYVTDEAVTHEMNAFDAALAVLALAKLGGSRESFATPLACLAESFGEGGRRHPYLAYEWNKMKTPTRIVVGGPEVTSAFVLSALVHARRALT